MIWNLVWIPKENFQKFLEPTDGAEMIQNIKFEEFFQFFTISRLKFFT